MIWFHSFPCSLFLYRAGFECCHFYFFFFSFLFVLFLGTFFFLTSVGIFFVLCRVLLFEIERVKESCGESMVLCPRGFLSASITQSSMGVLTFFLLLLLEVGYCFSCSWLCLSVLCAPPAYWFFRGPLFVAFFFFFVCFCAPPVYWFFRGPLFVAFFFFFVCFCAPPVYWFFRGPLFVVFSFSLSVFVFPDCPSGDHLLCSLRQTLQPVGWVCLWASNLSHFSRGFQSSSVRVCSLPEDFLSSCLDVISIHCLGW